MRQARWLLIGVWLVVSASACAQAGAAARKESNTVSVNGAPTVLMWARGLREAADLDGYAAAGFNTAYLLISGASAEQLAALSALMSEAEARGLSVVAAVTPDALRDSEGQQMAPDPTSEVYTAAVTDLVSKLVSSLGSHPGLVGWSIEAVPPNGFPWNDDGFRAHLRDWYGSTLSRLNDSWGASLDDWSDITLSGARDIDAGNPAGLGRASSDAALYREDAYADALDLWARALHSADSGRLVFASALPDYRSIISVRADFDGLILNTYPTVAEQDWLTHNVQAVDIARRGNQFAAVPTLLVDSNSDANRTANWMNEALLHGAAGLALSSWSVVKESEDLRAMVRQIADAIRASGAFPAKPLARIAVVYEPIAGGATRNGQGLYGYLDGLAPDEPTTLFALARLGTRYGQMDVLALSSIGQADLSQYGTILVPMALYLPEAAQVALNDFVLRGGALVVDAGVGMYQADGTVNGVPPVMMELLGMRYTEIAGENQPGELGSLGEPGQAAEPGIAIPVGPGEAGLSIDPDVARFADILGQFLSRPDVRKYLGEEFVGENGPGFRVRGLGRGFAVYTPTFLYESWNADDPYFNDFHQRLLSWRPDLEVIQPEGLWPPVGAATYANWSFGLASPDGSAASIDVFGAPNQLYQVPLGAARTANPEEDERIELLFPGAPLAVARPLPIYVRTQDEGGIVTTSVVRYDAQGIELLINGIGAQANVTPEGVGVNGGDFTNVEIEIRDGPYRLVRGSMHRVVLVEGPRNQVHEETMMPNADTGALVIQATIRWARLTITPAPEQ